MQTACGLRNGFQYTVQLQIEGACMRLALNEADQRLVSQSAGGVPPLLKAHFDWVTEAGTKEQYIVVRAQASLSGKLSDISAEVTEAGTKEQHIVVTLQPSGHSSSCACY